jgi:hypothetical protein
MYVVFDLFSVVEAHIIRVFQNNDTRFQITPEDGGLSKAVMGWQTAVYWYPRRDSNIFSTTVK